MTASHFFLEEVYLVLSMFVHVCAHVHAHTLSGIQVLSESRRGCWIPYSWSYRLLRAVQYERWEADSIEASPAPASSFIPILLYLVGDLWLLVFDFFS